jgi:hypothetical protein
MQHFRGVLKWSWGTPKRTRKGQKCPLLMVCTGGRCGETILDIGDSPRIFQCFFPAAVDVIYLNYFCCLSLHYYCMIDCIVLYCLYCSVTLLDTISLIVTLLCFIVTRKKGSEEGSEWVSEWDSDVWALRRENGDEESACVSLSPSAGGAGCMRHCVLVVQPQQWFQGEWVSDGVIIALVLMSLIYFSGCKASPIIFVKRKV